MMAGEPAEADLRSAMEGLEPVVLLNTAWETALATGVLTHMEFTIVSALSLTPESVVNGTVKAPKRVGTVRYRG